MIHKYLILTSNNTKKNFVNGVVSGVISATEAETEELERFHFFRLRLRSAYDLVKTGGVGRRSRRSLSNPDARSPAL